MTGAGHVLRVREATTIDTFFCVLPCQHIVFDGAEAKTKMALLSSNALNAHIDIYLQSHTEPVN